MRGTHRGYGQSRSAAGTYALAGDVRSAAELISGSVAAGLAWHDQALCAQTDPELFFLDHEPVAAVFGICRACPVRMKCLEDALSHPRWDQHGSYGIWGGLTVAARRRLLKQHEGNVAAALAAELEAA